MILHAATHSQTHRQGNEQCGPSGTNGRPGVAGRIFNDAHTQTIKHERLPRRHSGLTRMFGSFNIAPVYGVKGDGYHDVEVVKVKV